MNYILALLLVASLTFTGCNSVSTAPVDVSFLAVQEPAPQPELQACTKQEYDSVLIGRIVYADGTPYKRGAIKVEGANYENMGVTDDDGNFDIGIIGDERFFLSASSPFGDFVFYKLAAPLLVPKYTTSPGYLCEYDMEVFTCIEEGPLQ